MRDTEVISEFRRKAFATSEPTRMTVDAFHNFMRERIGGAYEMYEDRPDLNHRTQVDKALGLGRSLTDTFSGDGATDTRVVGMSDYRTDRGDYKTTMPIVEFTMPDNLGTVVVRPDAHHAAVSFELAKPLPKDTFGKIGFFDASKGAEPEHTEGMPKHRVYGPFEKNQSRFTVQINGGPWDLSNHGMIWKLFHQVTAAAKDNSLNPGDPKPPESSIRATF